MKQCAVFKTIQSTSKALWNRKKHTHKFVETECSCSAFYVTLCSRFGNLVGLAPVIQDSNMIRYRTTETKSVLSKYCV